MTVQYDCSACGNMTHGKPDEDGVVLCWECEDKAIQKNYEFLNPKEPKVCLNCGGPVRETGTMCFECAKSLEEDIVCSLCGGNHQGYMCNEGD